MTVSSENRKAGPFSGNDIAATFPFAFRVFSATDIRVVRRGIDGAETDLVLDESYAVTLNEDQNATPGGDVLFVAPPATGETIVITSRIPRTQEAEILNGGGFYPSVVTDALDRVVVAQQEMQEELSRSVRVPITSSDDPSGLTAAIVTLAAYADDIPSLAEDAQTALGAAALATDKALATAADRLATESARDTATGAASTAAGAAATATEQAGIATTKAVEAAGSATGAATSKTGADAAKVAAEAARDSVNSTGKVFVSPAAGIAGTTSDQTFAVLDAGLLYWIVYKNNAGSAVEVARSYTKAYHDSILDSENYGASGFAWAVVDSAGNIVIGVESDGSITLGNQSNVADAIPGAHIASEHFEARAAGSGYAFAIADANNNLAFAVLADGTVMVYGKEVAPQSQVSALSDLTIGTKSVVCWGDSLTEGSGSTGGQTYPAQLGTLLGVTPINEGFGSQNAAQITARQGGNSAMVTVSGNQIPASGSVAVTLDMNLLQYPVAATLSIYGYLGGIYGTLTKDTSNNYTFTRATAGSATKVAPATPFIVTKSTRNTTSIDLDQAINIIWAGSNDVGTAGMADVQANVEKCIAKLTPNKKRFLILSPIPNSAYTVGTAAHIAMRAVTDALKAKWPRNFIDIHYLLLENYNSGVPQDVTDYANKVVPSTLRSDNIHLNNTGYGIVAAAVAALINSKGWLA